MREMLGGWDATSRPVCETLGEQGAIKEKGATAWAKGGGGSGWRPGSIGAWLVLRPSGSPCAGSVVSQP